MPIDPTPELVAMIPHQVNVPLPDGAGMFVAVSIQSDGTADPEVMDATLMGLLDHLQEWPGRRPDADVTGVKYETNMYFARPTNPIPPPAGPEPEPETP
jgi:hypothetical protein